MNFHSLRFSKAHHCSAGRGKWRELNSTIRELSQDGKCLVSSRELKGMNIFLYQQENFRKKKGDSELYNHAVSHDDLNQRSQSQLFYWKSMARTWQQETADKRTVARYTAENEKKKCDATQLRTKIMGLWHMAKKENKCYTPQLKTGQCYTPQLRPGQQYTPQLKTEQW